MGENAPLPRVVDVSSTISPSFPGVTATGVTGTDARSRFVGGTVAGSPTTGTFTLGDMVVSQDGHIYICTVSGTPGTWVTA